ncbi:serine/threonine-protein kinase [Roseomonas xinghualingensis]|uniref:serine/threonine-protein kinase n=1 Tax=Roseomonas xinghualingensis TaxID=2986475 RepID=UPI0021F22843|nr:serine/threonine-protein kinase [Roseomonas sp. SXEYE001]MCV4209653.1 serine/threonine protein kinase [Roseomonas sp. SXEYE001]
MTRPDDVPLSLLLKAIAARHGTERRSGPNVVGPAQLAAFHERIATLHALLVPILGTEATTPLPLLCSIPPERIFAAEAALATAESYAGEAARRRATGMILMASGDFAVLAQVIACRDEAIACARAALHDLRRGLAILADEPPGEPAAPAAPGADLAEATMPEEDTVQLPPRAPVPQPSPSPVPPPTTEAPSAAPAASASLRRLLLDEFRFGEDSLLLAGRYEIRDRIGRGSFGTVLEAFDRALRRLVAVKIMAIPPDDTAETAELHERFRQEARAVARLSHPGIVPVHDFGEERDAAWIVMELVIGENLQTALRRDGALAPAEANRIATELLEALAFAHGRGIVHRDVKAANILLAASVDPGLGGVRLVDFGVARFGDGQSTHIGEMVGTLTTMSPEQVRGEAVDQRADLWAAGVILYQMLTGSRPFEGPSAALIASILNDEPEPPSRRRPGLPAAYDALLDRALAKRAEDRFPDAAAFIEALRRAGRENEPPVPPVEPGTTRTPFARVFLRGLKQIAGGRDRPEA